MYPYGWINSFNWLLFSNLGSEMAGICMFKNLDVNFLSNSVSCFEKNFISRTNLHKINNQTKK